jgi:GT2 family glycosyltransferase
VSPKVSIIILNWNGWKDTIECLESLYQITYPNYDVIVMDNGSEDKSIEKIKEYAEGKIKVESKFFKYNPSTKPIRIIEYTREEAEAGGGKENGIANLPSNRKMIIIKNEKNYGFAEGNNIAMKYALKVLNPDYILLLNNDTIVDKTFLEELVKVMESDEKIGSAQPILLRLEKEVIDSLGQELLKWGARDKGMNSKIDYSNLKNLEIFGTCAAASLYRCKLLKKIGLFDKDFFFIYEDVDLSWRIRLNGFLSVLVSKSIVYHKRGISERTPLDKELYLLKGYHANKNKLLIALRYYPLSIILTVILKTPWQFFHTLFRCGYYSLKLKRFREFSECVLRSWKIRKKIQTNHLLPTIQTKWIKRK